MIAEYADYDEEDLEELYADDDLAVLSHRRISHSFLQWFGEAVVLHSAGIPSERFSSTFYSINTEAVLPILEGFVRDAAWQSAVERSPIYKQ